MALIFLNKVSTLFYNFIIELYSYSWYCDDIISVNLILQPSSLILINKKGGKYSLIFIFVTYTKNATCGRVMAAVRENVIPSENGYRKKLDVNIPVK